MSHFASPGFAAGLRHFFRRPSTWLLLGAGLLAADRLRWLPTAWTGATLIAVCALFALALVMRLARGGRVRHREVRVVILPLRKEKLP